MIRKKLVFLDIDGTILPKNQRITPRVREAFRIAEENGHCLCISSGRTYCEVPDEMKKFNGVISGAGACIMWKDKVLLNEFFTDEEVDNLIGLMDEAEAVYNIETFDNLCMTTADRLHMIDVYEKKPKEEWSILEFFKRTVPLESLKGVQKAQKCVFFETKKEISWFREKLDKWDMNLAAYDDKSGEITKRALSKGAAIRRLSEYLGIAMEDTIAIGDSENDLEMLKAAGIGIAMGNAPDCVKDVADYVTKSVEEDGVYYAFQKYGLLS